MSFGIAMIEDWEMIPWKILVRILVSFLERIEEKKVEMRCLCDFER